MNNKKGKISNIIFNLTEEPYSFKTFGDYNKCLINHPLIQDIFDCIHYTDPANIILQMHDKFWYITEYGHNDEYCYQYVTLRSYQINYLNLLEDLPAQKNISNEEYTQVLLSYIENNMKYYFIDTILLEDYMDPENKIDYFLFNWHRPATETFVRTCIDELKQDNSLK